MLAEAKKKLPDDVKESVRFEIAKVKGSIQGNKTIISNLIQIAQHMSRSEAHLIKYLSREIALPAEIKGNFVFFAGKAPASKINEKITSYVEKYVICKECGKPDTTLKKEGGISFLRCQACGARYSVQSKI